MLLYFIIVASSFITTTSFSLIVPTKYSDDVISKEKDNLMLLTIIFRIGMFILFATLGSSTRQHFIKIPSLLSTRKVSIIINHKDFFQGISSFRRNNAQRPRLNMVMSCCGDDVVTTTTRTMIMNYRGGETTSIDDNKVHSSNSSYCHQVYIAVGSNLGNRYDNIRKALALLEETSTINQNDANEKIYHNHNIRIVRTSFLYETAPMYVTDQPKFLNGVIEIETSLLPFDLLHRMKEIEKIIGRDLEASKNHRYGPRPIDLDILLFNNITTKDLPITKNDSTDNKLYEKNHPVIMDTEILSIPHPRMLERDFVLIPLLDIIGRDVTHPIMNITMFEAFNQLCDGTNGGSTPSVTRVIPLPNNRFISFHNGTIIMGILNVTPDSFSDGGTLSIQTSINQAIQMINDGANIIDIGGESTRPGAKEIIMDEELNRTIPVIIGIRKELNIPISIDTRHSIVAKAAIEAGADIVNDVSGGTFDPNMFSTVSQLGVPIIIMHMRGIPETMQSMTKYDNVVLDVTNALLLQCNIAEKNGIHRWNHIIDPGIGFSKDIHGNIALLRNISTIRDNCNAIPILLGTSRKGFIGTLTGVTDPKDRDVGTIASYVASICLDRTSYEKSCNIIRVHNVAACKQAILVMDAIRRG